MPPRTRASVRKAELKAKGSRSTKATKTATGPLRLQTVIKKGSVRCPLQQNRSTQKKKDFNVSGEKDQDKSICNKSSHTKAKCAGIEKKSRGRDAYVKSVQKKDAMFEFTGLEECPIEKGPPKRTSSQRKTKRSVISITGSSPVMQLPSPKRVRITDAPLNHYAYQPPSHTAPSIRETRASKTGSSINSDKLTIPLQSKSVLGLPIRTFTKQPAHSSCTTSSPDVSIVAVKIRGVMEPDSACTAPLNATNHMKDSSISPDQTKRDVKATDVRCAKKAVSKRIKFDVNNTNRFNNTRNEVGCGSDVVLCSENAFKNCTPVHGEPAAPAICNNNVTRPDSSVATGVSTPESDFQMGAEGGFVKHILQSPTPNPLSPSDGATLTSVVCTPGDICTNIATGAVSTFSPGDLKQGHIGHGEHEISCFNSKTGLLKPSIEGVSCPISLSMTHNGSNISAAAVERKKCTITMPTTEKALNLPTACRFEGQESYLVEKVKQSQQFTRDQLESVVSKPSRNKNSRELTSISGSLALEQYSLQTPVDSMVRKSDSKILVSRCPVRQTMVGSSRWVDGSIPGRLSAYDAKRKDSNSILGAMDVPGTTSNFSIVQQQEIKEAIVETDQNTLLSKKVDTSVNENSNKKIRLQDPLASGKSLSTSKELAQSRQDGNILSMVTSTSDQIDLATPKHLSNASTVKKNDDVSSLDEICSKSFRREHVPKRVRFCEPSQPLRTSRKNVRLLQLIRRRRERSLRHAPPDIFGDVSDALLSESGSNGDTHQILFDELQYLLDGVFQNKTFGELNSHLVVSSLHSLVRLLLRKVDRYISDEHPRSDAVFSPVGTQNDAGNLSEAGSDATFVDVLTIKPALLKKVVKPFFLMLGNKREVDALVGLVLTVIFRATGSALFLSENELEILLNSYVQNCFSCLTENATMKSSGEVIVQKIEEKPEEVRRRGIFAKRDNNLAHSHSSINTLNELTCEAGVVDHDYRSVANSLFRHHTEGAAYLLGTVLSALLAQVNDVRAWMRNNRRLDRIVAVIYSCEALARKQLRQIKLNRGSNFSLGPRWRIVVGGALRTLEFAALDSVCQSRIMAETKVVSIAVNVVQWVGPVKAGSGLDSEWVICCALKVCINLMQDFEGGAHVFSDVDGIQVVLDRLVEECSAAGLIRSIECDKTEGGATLKQMGNIIDGVYGRSTSEESFDVRVLCLVLLANVVYRDHDVGEVCLATQLRPTRNVSAGVLGIALEILKQSADYDPHIAIGDSKAGNVEHCNIRDADVPRYTNDCDSPCLKMERKITIGYVCLLIGALARQSEKNRELLEAHLPKNGLQGVADVLQEFLEFHREVGVLSSSMDSLYDGIISTLTGDLIPFANKADVRESLIDTDVFASSEYTFRDTRTPQDPKRSKMPHIELDAVIGDSV